MAAPPKDARALLNVANYHAHWSIDLADTKANILMAASAILAGLLAGQAFPACSAGAVAVLLLAVGLALATAGACLAVLFPRTRSAGPPSLLHFEAIIQFASGADYLAQVQGATPADTDREIAQQNWELARIESRKFYWLRWAVRLFGLCLTSALVGVVWAHLPCG